MGQKTNPISLRLQNGNRNFDSVWYSDHFYAKCFSRELYITNYFNTFLKLVKLPQARISVNFGIQNIKLYPFFCIPKASRVSLAKNLGLFQHLSKAWSDSGKQNKFGINSTSKHSVNTLNDNLFFKTTLQDNASLQIGEGKSSSFVPKNNHSGEFHFLENISAKLLLNSSVSDLSWSKQITETNPSKRLLKNLLVHYYLIAAANKNLSGENSRNIELARLSTNLQPKSFENFFGIDYTQNKDINSFYLVTNENTENPINFSKMPNKVKNGGMNRNTSLSLMPRQEELYNKFCLSTETKGGADSILFEKTNIEMNSTVLYNTLGNTKSMISQKNFKYKNHIESFLSSHYNIDFQLFPFLSKQNWQSAGFIADEIVYFLERRISFSRIKNRILRQASMQPFIRGIRITCNGRVGGKSKKAQRATQECVKYGETSLHVFECKIDFASRSAHTSFGLVGIKVWICFK